MTAVAPRVAIVDYGVGNLFSVARACERVGLASIITTDRRDVLAADAVILPGVGAFGTAMTRLHNLDLVDALRDAAMSGRPLVGICLGMQLLMTESEEFGRHEGLGIISGVVRRFVPETPGQPRRKVPHIGWSRVDAGAGDGPWQASLLRSVAPSSFMYFVHSYFVRPSDDRTIVAETTYAGVKFCSSVASGAVFGCQFHPERSGEIGLNVYRELACRLAG